MIKADIKLIRSLNDKQALAESGLFVVEGDKMVSEALASGFYVERVLVTPKSGLTGQTGYAGRQVGHVGQTGHAEGQTIQTGHAGHVVYSEGQTIQIGHAGGQAVEIVSEKEMERVSHLKTPSAALALVQVPKYRFSTGIFSNGLVLALDDVQDPGNLGNIIRIADWFGIGDVLCSPATADWLNPKAVQATMGALFRVRLHYVELAEVLAGAARSGTEVFGAFLNGENIYDVDLPETGVIVMGNEGKGISPNAERAVTRRLFIPPYPSGRDGSESLNVAAATAVVCSEFRRRRIWK